MTVAVAVVQASSCNSDLTPSLGPSKCHGCGPKKTKKKKKRLVYIRGLNGGCIQNDYVIISGFPGYH